jgi:hypothetical protein
LPAALRGNDLPPQEPRDIRPNGNRGTTVAIQGACVGRGGWSRGQRQTVCAGNVRSLGSMLINDKLKGSESNSGWKVSLRVRATCNEDGAVLLDIDHGLCYSLNAVGGRIWQVIEAGQSRSSFDDIVEALAQEFTKVPREQLMTDIDNCLRDLETKGLITAHGRTALAKAK